MAPDKTQLLPHHDKLIDRFTSACQLDDRIQAAFLGGSYARGTADRYSDVDLYIIVSDVAYDEFINARVEFLQFLGTPVFVEDFDLSTHIFFIFADGTEGELGIGRASAFAHLHGGPHRVLVDKTGILAGVEFAYVDPDPMEQVENLRRMVFWFWHDLSHLITAIGRGHKWWASGQLDVLRRVCCNLLRMRQNYLDPDAGDEPFFKVDQVVPAGQLSELDGTLCPVEIDAMLAASFKIVEVYKELAKPLANKYAIPYPDALEAIMVQRLEELQKRFR